MSDNRDRPRYGEPPEDPYGERTEIIPYNRRIEPEPVPRVEERYSPPPPFAEDRYSPPPMAEEREAQGRAGGGAQRAITRLARLIYFTFSVIESLIAIRAVLRLLGARSVGFARFMYDITQPLVRPFQGLFSEPGLGRYVLEFSSLVAIIVYALLAYALVRLLYLFSD